MNGLALLHICIDCGGSKTAACLSSTASETEILARGYAGPSNYKDNGLLVVSTKHKGFPTTNVEYIVSINRPHCSINRPPNPSGSRNRLARGR